MLSVRNLGFRYGNKGVLTDVTLELGRGANLFLGRNGAGKTTLMRVLAGAARPGSGEVRLNDAVLSRSMLRHVGWLPQTFGFPPRMRVDEFIAYAAWLEEVPSARVAERRSAVLDLAEQARQPLKALSGGQLRRAGLAAALVADPDILILNEPTAGLDPEQRDTFHDPAELVDLAAVVPRSQPLRGGSQS